MFQRALAISEHELGKSHPHTATYLNNLANLYHNQGKYQEAEPLHKRALTIKEHDLGENHPDTATTLNNLALLYRAQGKYQKAEPLLERALATLILAIALINVWNRLNVSTRQVAGEWANSAEARKWVE